MDLKIGDRVRTKKGCRFQGPSTGEIVRFGRWKSYDAASVKKDCNGDIRQFLCKNLVKIDGDENTDNNNPTDGL